MRSVRNAASLIKLLLLAFLIIPRNSFSQPVFIKQTNIPVSKGSRELLFPWTGGFNNPQFSGVDINNDGIKDLVVFDRSGDKTVTFINHGNSHTIDYEYAPKYEAAFQGFTQWMLMDDFNCDGVPDVFTYNIGSTDYYKGRYTQDNIIQFDSVTFFGYPSFIGGTIVNVFTSAPDIPAFADINGDGDIDVLSWNQIETQVEYYENQSKELTGTCGDTVIFKFVTDKWGKFSEPPGSFTEVLDSSCGSTGKTELRSSRQHDGAHTTLAFDENGDGVKDAIIGNYFYENINRLVNCGTKDTACICAQDNLYPSYDITYKVPIFGAAFYVDVNNDGLRDLLVSPNSKGTSENYKCIWMYENVGTEDSVVFSSRTDTMLIDQTLDFGEGAYPVFFDYNADELLDLVVGNYGYYVNGVSYRSELALLENVGTATAPSFKFVDLNYADMPNALGKKAVYPAFGDMDGDGDQDMIVGEIDGYLHYFRNDAGAGNPPSFVLTMPQMFNIDVGQYSAPFIYDVNGDSLPDLLVGEKSGNGVTGRNGEVNYFENIGTKTNFVFNSTPTNDVFGEIDVRIPTFPNGFCTPIITPLDSTGKLYILSGSEEGTIKVFEFDRSKIYSGAFTKVSNAYSGIDEGERTAVAVADLNHDGKMEMVVGNERGGLALFSQTDDTINSDNTLPNDGISFEVKVFPNPSSSVINLQLSNYASSKIDATLYDVIGKKIMHTVFASQPAYQLHLPAIASGVYFLKLSNGNHSRVSKVIIRQ